MNFEVIELGGMKTMSTKSACNHVYVVDVSGSMYNDLPKIRQHLKNIISVVAQPDDTFSVIYFSGRGQCGVVFENVLVSDASTVQMMHSSIDRYIKPIGLTGFMDPMQKSLDLNLDPSKVNNFIMLTDGYDNQSSRSDILLQSATLGQKYQSVTFIEYGFYADRDLLSKMAGSCGGFHIFADSIVKYESMIEDVVRGVSRVNNIEVKINKRAKHGVYIQAGQIKIVDAKDGIVLVPEDVERVYSIVPGDVLNKQLSEDHLYMILFYAAKTNFTELVWKTLQALGDVAMVEAYQNAFTKQEVSTFEDLVNAAVLDPALRYTAGKDLNAVPNKYAPTIITLLEELSGIDSQLVTSSPDWAYNRTGRSSTAIEPLPRFVPSPVSYVAMKGLVLNSSRPNVSVQTNLKGTVELPENDFGLKRVQSFITRNYTIIKDGIRNMDKLPVLFPESAASSLTFFPHEVIEEGNGKCYWVFDLTKIPVINRSMVENVKLEEFTNTVQYLEGTKAALKVLSFLIEEKLGGTTAKINGLIDEHGEDAAKWLSSIGVRDYGFGAVGTKSDEATDEYESIQVEYKIKGLSSLPAISAVRTKVKENKKLTLGDTLINMNLTSFESGGVDYEQMKTVMVGHKRELEAKLANIVYTLVLGRKWYGDDEVVSTTVSFDGLEADMTIAKVRKMVKI